MNLYFIFIQFIGIVAWLFLVLSYYRKNTNAILVLTAKNDENLLNEIEKLKEITEFMKNAETHPLSTIKRKLEDKGKYKGVIF